MNEEELAWRIAKAKAEGAMAVALKLEQPALATARQVTLGLLTECGDLFAAWERAQIATGVPQASLEPRHKAFWEWASAAVRTVAA